MSKHRSDTRLQISTRSFRSTVCVTIARVRSVNHPTSVILDWMSSSVGSIAATTRISHGSSKRLCYPINGSVTFERDESPEEATGVHDHLGLRLDVLAGHVKQRWQQDAVLYHRVPYSVPMDHQA
jgi:hypothetical protein